MEDLNNPFASPQTSSAIPDAEIDGPDGPLQLARKGTRLVAAILDSIFFAIVYFPIHFGLAFLFFPKMWSFQELIQPGMTQAQIEAVIVGNQPGTVFNLAMMAVGFLIFVLLQGFFLAKSSQTIGKKIFGIKIVRKDGSDVNFGRLIGRRYLPMHVIGAIPFIGVFITGFVDPLLIFRSNRNCLHDDIADTAVVIE